MPILVKVETQKEEKLKAALDRVNALEQELSEAKKVKSWYSWIIIEVAYKVKARKRKSRHFLLVSFLQALEEARHKQEELLASVDKEKKFVRNLIIANICWPVKLYVYLSSIASLYFDLLVFWTVIAEFILLVRGINASIYLVWLI